MRFGGKAASDSDYFNIEVAINELLKGSFASTADLTNVSDSAASQQLLAANLDRRGLIIFNDSTAILYIKFGVTASTSSFTVRLTPQGVYESGVPCYTGRVDGIWSADAAGAARISELT